MCLADQLYQIILPQHIPRNFTKGTRDFINRIKDPNNIPENCILALLDVVELYPHKKGLKIMLEYLDTQENKTVTIESLAELAKMILKKS